MSAVTWSPPTGRLSTWTRRAAGEHRRRGRAAAHVDADAAQVHLVVFQRGQRRGEGRGDHAFELQVGALDAVAQGVEGALGHGDDQQLEAQRAAEHGARVAHAALAVHRPGDRQQVDGAAAGQRDLGQGHVRWRASRSCVGDRPRAERDPAATRWTGQLAAGGGDGDALDDRAPATVSARSTAWAMASDGLVDVDDGAAAHAARLDVADAGGGQGAVALAHAVGLHDEAGDLGGAEVDRRDQRLAPAPSTFSPSRVLRRSSRRDIPTPFGRFAARPSGGPDCPVQERSSSRSDVTAGAAAAPRRRGWSDRRLDARGRTATSSGSRRSMRCEAELQDPLALVELVELDQGGVLVDRPAAGSAPPSFSRRSQRRSSTRTRASSRSASARPRADQRQDVGGGLVGRPRPPPAAGSGSAPGRPRGSAGPRRR